MNMIKIVKSQYGKESYRTIKDIEVNQETQTDVEDTITFIDSMYEKMKYKSLKEQLLKNIRLDVTNLIESTPYLLIYLLFNKESFNVSRK